MFQKESFYYHHARHFLIFGVVAAFAITFPVQPTHADKFSSSQKINSTLDEKEKSKLEKIQKEYDDMTWIIQQIGKESVTLQLKCEEAKKANDTKQVEKLSKKIRELDAEAKLTMQKYLELRRKLKRLSQKDPKNSKTTLQKLQKEYDDMTCVIQQIGTESVTLKLKRDEAQKTNDTKQAEELSKKIRELDAEARRTMQKHLELRSELKRLSPSKENQEKTKVNSVQ